MSDTRKPLVLVTGVSGFLAAHIVVQLLKSGYPVRGTVRKGKQDVLRKSLGDNYPSLELVHVEDISTGDLTEALKDVGAIIHVALPAPNFQIPPKDTIKAVIEGSLNVLRQADNAGITKVVVTSTYGTSLDLDFKKAFQQVVITEKDWGDVDEEKLVTGEPNLMHQYLGSKILAEQAAWKFADEHPTLDLATINPPFIFGPYAQHFLKPSKDSVAFSSNGHIYGLLRGNAPPLLPPYFCDVRDAAKAHVAALELPALSKGQVQGKRFLISGGAFTWKEAAQYLAEFKPELKDRLPSAEAFTPLPESISTIDTSRAKELLHLEEYIGWKKTVGDTVNALLEAEKAWDE